MKYDRIYCFGDSITLGCNDSQGLGWPGRLGLGLQRNERSLAVYNLGINGDTSNNIAARWRHETEVRSRNETGLILLAFGFNDASRPTNGELQVELQDSVTCAKELVLAAKSIGDVLWIGPTPLDESVNPLRTEFDTWTTYNDEIAGYDKAYAELAKNLGIDYLQLFPGFLQSERYRTALINGDGIHPGDDGYAMIAEKISAWPAWQKYL